MYGRNLLKVSFSLWILLTGAFNLTAQYVDLGTNPMSLLFASTKLTAEIPVSPLVSIEPQANYLFRSRRFWSSGYESTGYRIGLSTLLYFDEDRQHQGWYGFIYGRYGSISYFDRETVNLLNRMSENYRQSRLTLGFGGGFKHVFNHGLILGASLGAGRTFLDEFISIDDNGQPVDVTPQSGPILEDLLSVYGRLSIGYRFRSG